MGELSVEVNKRLIVRRQNLENTLRQRRKVFPDITLSFDCSKCKALETRIRRLDDEILRTNK